MRPCEYPDCKDYKDGECTKDDLIHGCIGYSEYKVELMFDVDA